MFKVLALFFVVALVAAARKRTALKCAAPYNCIPGLDSIGIGIDSVTGDLKAQKLFQLSFTKKTTWANPFHANLVYSVPDQLQVIDRTSSGSNSNIYHTSTEYANKLSHGAGVEGGYGAVFSGSVEVNHAKTFLSGGDSALSVTEETVKLNSMSLLPPHLLKVSDSLKNAMTKHLPSVYDARKYNTFVSYFGTHYITSATFGGKATMMSSIKRSYLGENSDLVATANAKVQFQQMKGAEVGASFSHSSSSKDYKEACMNSWSIKMVGGNSHLNISDWSKWTQSVKLAPAQISFRLVPFEHLMPDEARANNFRRFLSEYYKLHNHTVKSPPPQPFRLQRCQCQSFPYDGSNPDKDSLITGMELKRGRVGGTREVCRPCVSLAGKFGTSSLKRKRDDWDDPNPAQQQPQGNTWCDPNDPACQTGNTWCDPNDPTCQPNGGNNGWCDPNDPSCQPQPTTTTVAPTPIPYSTPSSNTTCGAHQCLPGLDSVGIGFDALSGELRNLRAVEFTYKAGNKWTNPFFKKLIYNYADQVTVVTKTTSNRYATTYNDTTSYANDLALKAGLTAGMGAYSASASVEQSRKKLKGSQAILSVLSHELTLYEIDLGAFPAASATLAAVEAWLPQKYYKPAYDTFVRHFGTHFVSEARYGGVARQQTIVDQHFFTNNDESTVAAGVNGQYAMFKAGVKVNRKSSESMKSFSENSISEIVLEGGNYESIKVDEWEKWQQSTRMAPTQVSFKLHGIEELFADSTKASNMKKHIATYLKAGALKNKPVEVSSQRPVGYGDVKMSKKQGCDAKKDFFLTDYSMNVPFIDTALSPAECRSVKWSSPGRNGVNNNKLFACGHYKSQTSKCDKGGFMVTSTYDLSALGQWKPPVTCAHLCYY